jgi:UDPglucose--hexose-1-phosphate uridylyltransferase
MWILPKHHDSEFEDIQKHEAVNLSLMLKDVLGKMNRVLDNPAYNYLVHSAPLKEPHLQHYHWHIEIKPKLTKVAGLSGAAVSTSTP